MEIRGARLREALHNNRIPIIAGFQGISQNKEITTLGRGGSDVTAVAIAAYLNAKQCELYKDVGGIKTENPADFTNLKHIYNITYGEILELTTAGAEVIHPRACALAYKYNIPILIKSFNRKGLSTMIKTDCSNYKNKTEKAFVRAIAHSDDLCRLSLIAVPQLSKCLHQVIVRFAEAHVPLILFSHGIPYHKKFDLSFIVKKAHFKKAKTVLDNAMKIVNAENLVIADNLASISLIGPGISGDVEIFSTLFEALHKMSLHIDAFSSSETKITCFLNKKDTKKAVKALLKKFNLINKKSNGR
jgi:aspartate kinase